METKRLNATERDDLVHLYVAFCILTDLDNGLDERARLIKGCNRDLAMIRTKISRIIEQMKETLPDDQKRMFDNVLRMSSYTVGVKGPASDGRRNDEYGTWISWNGLNAFLEGCKDHCRMCTMDKYAQKRCELRKALDIIPNDENDKSYNGECPYYIAL